jgi:site-specific DNA-cytosine methylase
LFAQGVAWDPLLPARVVRPKPRRVTEAQGGDTMASGPWPGDSNGMLTTVFADIICALKPSFFVIENVPGLHFFHKHRKFLEKKIIQLQQHKYVVDFRILNALELAAC